MFSMPKIKPLTTKSVFKTSALSLQIESKCFQYLKKSPIRQNPTSKHPPYHFKSSPSVFNTSKKAQYDKTRLQNIRLITSNRVQVFSIPQKKPNTTKPDFKTSALSLQIESKCFQYLKKSPLRQNPSSKHPLYHFKSSPSVFNTSKKAQYDKIRLQNIRLITSNRVQVFSIPQKKPNTTKPDFKTSALSLQIESKKYQYLKKSPIRQHPLYHFKSSPSVFNTSKKAQYDKTRLQNIRFIISNRVQVFSIPQKKPNTTKPVFKTSALSFQIESKCFQYLKKSPLRQNPSSKHPLYHFKSSPSVFNTSKKAPYDKTRLQNIRFIISNRVQVFSIPQKKPLTTKPDFKTSALSFQIESKCFQYLKKSPLRQNPTSKHPLYLFKSSPSVFNTSKKPLTTKSDFKTLALSFQIESKCFQYLKKCPLRQNPTSKHPLYHFKSSPSVFYASKKAPYDKIRLQNIRFIISNRVQVFSMPQKKPLTTKSDFKTSASSFQIESKCFLCLKKSPLPQNPTSKHPVYHFKSSPSVSYASKKAQYNKIRLQNIRCMISDRVQVFSMPQKKPLTTKSDFKTSASSFQIESKCFLCLKIPLTTKSDF